MLLHSYTPTTTLRTMPKKDTDIGVNEPDDQGYTQLYRAARNGETGRCQNLLNSGAKIDKPNLDGWTALHVAARWGHTTTVELLLANGANKTLKYSFGVTALELALQNKHEETAQRLACDREKLQWFRDERARLAAEKRKEEDELARKKKKLDSQACFVM